MKCSTLFLLPVVASASILNARQFGGGKAHVAGVDKLTPRIRAGAQRTLTKFGPYTLNGSKGGASAGGMGGHSMGDSTLSGQTFMLNINKGFCNDEGPCTVLAGKVGVMFEDGSEANPAKGIYIHHVLTSDRTKKTSAFISSCNSPTRPGTSISSMMGGTGFVGTGEDAGDRPYLYVTPNGKSNTGFWVDKGDQFSANVQLVNYNQQTKRVFVTYDLEWVPGKVGQNTKTILTSISQCGTSIKLNHAGAANSTSGKFTFLESGKILTARGHLHDGGEAIHVYLNNKHLFDSKAEYGGEGSETKVGNQEWKTISGMTMAEGPIAAKKGDQLYYVVEYDLKKHPLRKSAGGHEAGVMGMLALTFAPD